MYQKQGNTAIPTAVFLFFAYLFVYETDAQYNLRVPVKNCKISTCMSCYTIDTQKVFNVKEEVSLLSDLYTFCTAIRSHCQKQSRIILVVDASASMCMEVTGCEGASNNDPTNKRIEAAMAFVDTLAKRGLECEVGVIIYTGVGNDSTGARTTTRVLPAMKVNSAMNLDSLHNAINDGACKQLLRGVEKIRTIEKYAKRTLTFTGIALDSAIHLVDAGYDTLPDLDRHIILLTDGDWQKPIAADLFAAYEAGFPGRPLPTVHGVFLSDSVTHVAMGFPPQGLLTCNDSVRVPPDLTSLQQAAERTNGNYLPGTTPQTIVNAFFSLMTDIIYSPPVCALSSVQFTNLATDEQRMTVFRHDSINPGHYVIPVPSFPLEYGVNTFMITMIAHDINQHQMIIMDTIIVNRRIASDTGSAQACDTGSGCFADTMLMSISCRPGSLLTTEFDTVTARVKPTDVSKFVPNNILLRVVTPFPDKNDGRTIALFHLDSNLSNNVPGGPAATGTPTFKRDNAAFGYSMVAGLFNIAALPVPLTGDFTVECWVRPAASIQRGEMIRGSGFSMQISADGYPAAAIGSTSIQSAYAMDRDVWQHIAIARINGKANLYINGIPKDNAEPVDAAGSISGVLTVNTATGVWVDEVRVSTVVRSSAILGRTVLQLPYAENLMWKINTTATANVNPILPEDVWQGTPLGQAQFTFSNMLPGSSIINFFDTMTIGSGSIMWSKNGDPVVFNGIDRIGNIIAERANTGGRDHAIKVFDLNGRLLQICTMRMLSRKRVNFQGVYFIKYPNGKIERRMTMTR